MRIFELPGTELVQHYPHMVTDSPLVSVVVPTYKHEAFIGECLDSILMQKTDFPFEIIVGEDKSPDRTREICIEYANNHPEKIRLFLHDRRNVIKIEGNPTGRYNLIFDLTEANGKYIALCEGDDFWIDPDKLQKQIDFLETNSDYSLCFTDADILVEANGSYDERGFLEYYKRRGLTSKKIGFYDFSFGHCMPTCTIVFRRNFLKIIPKWFLKIPIGDWGLVMLLLWKGPGTYFEERTAVYRIHQSNMYMNWSQEKKQRLGRLQREILRNKFGAKVNRVYTRHLLKVYSSLFREEQSFALKLRYFLMVRKYFLIDYCISFWERLALSREEGKKNP